MATRRPASATLRTLRPARGRLVILCALALGCGAPAEDDVPIESLDPATLHFLAPAEQDVIDAGDGIDIAVYTQNAAARRVQFAIDGADVGACDASDAISECHADGEWHFAFTFENAGDHAVRATFTDAAGQPVVATRTIHVRVATNEAIDPSASESDLDPTSTGQLVDEGTSTVVQAIGARGYLDPNQGWHSKFGGREWQVQSQRVVLRNASIDGSRSAAMRCVQRYGEWIERYADVNYISRASVVAALAMRGDCEAAEARPFHPLIRPGDCAQIARHDQLGLDSGQCRSRMQQQPDFAIQMAVRYLATHSARRRHHNDPPKIAALLSAGALHSSSRDEWHMRAGPHAIDTFVAAYNAYRTWEHRDGDLRTAFRSVVHGRMIQHGHPMQPDTWTLDGETPDTVAQAIGSLHPRYVSGLIRLGPGVAATLDDTHWQNYRAAFDQVRNVVHTTHPDALFDVVLNAQDYNNIEGGPTASQQLLADMALIRTHLAPQVWFFDFYQPAMNDTDGSKEAVRAAIDDAHAHGEYIGGNTWNEGVPDGSDFVAMPDFLAANPSVSMLARTLLEVKADAIAAIRRRSVPVLLHINNDPQLGPDTESCYWMGQCRAAESSFPHTCNHPDWDFSRAQRTQYLEIRAGEQSQLGYHFMYPVFFPICPVGISYAAPRDGDMMNTLRRLMAN